MDRLKAIDRSAPRQSTYLAAVEGCNCISRKSSRRWLARKRTPRLPPTHFLELPRQRQSPRSQRCNRSGGDHEDLAAADVSQMSRYQTSRATSPQTNRIKFATPFAAPKREPQWADRKRKQLHVRGPTCEHVSQLVAGRVHEKRRLNLQQRYPERLRCKSLLLSPAKPPVHRHDQKKRPRGTGERSRNTCLSHPQLSECGFSWMNWQSRR